MLLPKLPENFSWADNIQLGTPEVYRLSQISWPRFLLEESDVPDPILKFQISAQDFNERFRIFGIRYTPTHQLVAFIQAVHVEADAQARDYSDMGWRFSIQDAARKSTKNALSLVEASVDPEFRGHGLSKLLIERAKCEAKEQGFPIVIAPVRTTLKAQHPSESMEDYLSRRDSRGRSFDPWLRTHVNAGAEVLNTCGESVLLKASLEKWREWTHLPLEKSGPQIIDGALMPVMIDTQAGTASYTEPNVWVKYTL